MVSQNKIFSFKIKHQVKTSFLSDVEKTVIGLLLLQGMTLLHWACDRGNCEMVKLLLRNGASVNLQVIFI